MESFYGARSLKGRGSQGLSLRSTPLVVPDDSSVIETLKKIKIIIII
jgi:hypothetical protein